MKLEASCPVSSSRSKQPLLSTKMRLPGFNAPVALRHVVSIDASKQTHPSTISPCCLSIHTPEGLVAGRIWRVVGPPTNDMRMLGLCTTGV